MKVFTNKTNTIENLKINTEKAHTPTASDEKARLLATELLHSAQSTPMSDSDGFEDFFGEDFTDKGSIQNDPSWNPALRVKAEES
jgi:hypothetical protein